MAGAVGLALVAGYVTAVYGILVPLALLGVPILIALVAAIFYNPRLGLFFAIGYCFLLFIPSREIGGLPFGMGIDGLLIITWIAVFFNYRKYKEWPSLKNDLWSITLVWFVINILELSNPAGASPMGWLQEVRGTALYWFLSVPLCLLLFTNQRHLNIFLLLIISLSVLATLNGLKQLHLGLSVGEARFLAEGAAKTHILFGKLRVFSFYSDAGQFGASQAHIGLIALILALGPFKWWKRLLLLFAAGLLLYGMLISGTRGALFALATGVVIALVLSKNLKILLIGGAIAFSGFVFLKYTHIGHSNYQIYRFRTALNPEDASLNVRLENQKILRAHLSTRPLGLGLGSVGFWGSQYNKDKPFHNFPPDSYWVKVWAMYGIVGLVIWFGMMMYILGKCCGIVWNIQNKALRTKLIALTAGAGGILMCSYGNEVINLMPSALIVYASWSIVFLGPRLDREQPL